MSILRSRVPILLKSRGPIRIVWIQMAVLGLGASALAAVCGLFLLHYGLSVTSVPLRGPTGGPSAEILSAFGLTGVGALLTAFALFAAGATLTLMKLLDHHGAEPAGEEEAADTPADQGEQGTQPPPSNGDA